MNHFNHESDLCKCARLTDELINKAFRIKVTKALNPLDPNDFVIISAQISRALQGIARPEQGKALREALNVLDVDWPNITDPARRQVIEAARMSIAGVGSRVIKPITYELNVRGSRIVRGSRNGAREQLTETLSARIGVDMALRDRRIIQHLSTSQGLFVTNNYVQRSEFFSARARNIVAAGLEDGLGRDDISKMLRDEIRGQLGPGRGRQYFNVIAGVFTNRSRTYAQLAAYEEAGIRRWIFEAVLDERTTPQCAMLHGRVWEVRESLQRYEQVEQSQDPQAVKDLMPWIRNGRNADGSEYLYIADRQGNRTHVADIVQNRVGQRDAIGQYANAMNNQQLADMGANNPPIHPLCRSTIVADV